MADLSGRDEIINNDYYLKTITEICNLKKNRYRRYKYHQLVPNTKTDNRTGDMLVKIRLENRISQYYFSKKELL